MKKLCFGTLLNLVCQAKGQGVTYRSICDAVFSAYGCTDTTNRDSSLPPHLKSGHDNVPPDVIDAARAITYEDAVIAFDSGVVGLIAEANAKQFIYAVKAVLREDDVPDDTLIGSVAGFEKSAILERNKFIMAPLMASLFRYAIVDVSNADCADSLKSFEKNYLTSVDSSGQLFIDSIDLFGLDRPQKQVQIKDALRFADLLSKSTYAPTADRDHQWGQEIATLLHLVYPQDEAVKYYLGSVLSAVGNYRGLKAPAVGGYKSADVLDGIFYEFDKESHLIPGRVGEYFFHDQKSVYDRLGDPYFSYSGPTSMGKSFVVQTYIKRHGSWRRLLRRDTHRTGRHRMSGIRLQGNCFVEFAVSLTTIIIIRLPIKNPLPHTAV